MKMEALMEVTTETLTLKLMNESVCFVSCLASIVTGNCKPYACTVKTVVCYAHLTSSTP